jgi:hypothetical protein
VHPPDKIKEKKKLRKEHYTGSQDLQFLLESTELEMLVLLLPHGR